VGYLIFQHCCCFWFLLTTLRKNADLPKTADRPGPDSSGASGDDQGSRKPSDGRWGCFQWFPHKWGIPNSWIKMDGLFQGKFRLVLRELFQKFWLLRLECSQLEDCSPWFSGDCEEPLEGNESERLGLRLVSKGRLSTWGAATGHHAATRSWIMGQWFLSYLSRLCTRMCPLANMAIEIQFLILW
jgi:hypothetical protein